MKTNSSLGSRMKQYESVPKIYLTAGIPKVIRLDMRSGHTFCKKLKKPFDDIFSYAMIETAKKLCSSISGAVMAYTQSDEISVVLNDVTPEGNLTSFFDGNVEKITSLSASIATLAFNKAYAEAVEKQDKETADIHKKNLWNAQFDSRVFCLPNAEELHNYILWRQQDATRNSIQMVGHANFTNKEMHKKNTSQIQDMLMLQKGINWNDFPIKYKRGALIVKEKYQKEAKDKDGNPIKVMRSRWVEYDIPILTKDTEIIEKLYSRCYLVKGAIVHIQEEL